MCRVKFYGIFSKNPRISGIEECYRSYRGKTTGAACGICRQHNRTKNGRVNAETPAKKKPRLAPDGTHPSTLAYSLGPVAPYRLGSVVGVKCEEHDDAGSEERSLLVTFVKKQKTDVDAEAEFEFKDENQNNAKVLSLLKEKQEIEIAASQRGL